MRCLFYSYLSISYLLFMIYYIEIADGKCAKGHITHGVVLSSSRVLRNDKKLEGRTSIECVLKCIENTECSSIYTDSQGNN